MQCHIRRRSSWLACQSRLPNAAAGGRQLQSELQRVTFQRGVASRGSAARRRAGTACLVHRVSRLGTAVSLPQCGVGAFGGGPVRGMKRDGLCPCHAQQLTLIEAHALER